MKILKIIGIITVLFIVWTFLSKPKEEKKETVKTELLATITKEETKKINIPPFPKFSTIKELLEDAGDYKEYNGTLKFKGKNNIQVSTRFIEAELKQMDNIKKQVNHDIIYTAFQIFAETDINEVTITSVPIILKDFADKATAKNYFNTLKKTVTINRLSAIAIMEKYLNTNSFNCLLEPNESNGIYMYLPSDKFSTLIYHNQNEIVSYLQNI